MKNRNSIRIASLCLAMLAFSTVKAQIFVPAGGVQFNTGGNNIGIGTNAPAGRLEIRAGATSGAALLLQNVQTAGNPPGGLPGTGFIEPDFALQVRRQTLAPANPWEGPPSTNHTTFSIQPSGRTKIGIFPADAPEMFAVNGSIAMYATAGSSIKFRYTSTTLIPELIWQSDIGRNFRFKNMDNDLVVMSMSPSGKLGVGTENFVGPHTLYIKGSSIAEESWIKKISDWPDYVFNKDYKLMPLEEVAEYIQNNGRLPGMPSAEQVAEEGLALGETQRLLTEKVEELTLYLLQMSKEMEALREEITTLRGEK